MKIREFIQSKEGQKYIKEISHKVKEHINVNTLIEDIESELYLLLLEKENVYDSRYKIETFIERCLLKRVVFIIRKKYYYYFHTDNGYEFIETEPLQREHIFDTEMSENIDSKLSVYEFLDSIEDREIIIDRLNDLTLEEIGEKMKITSEAVRQRIKKISKKALIFS